MSGLLIVNADDLGGNRLATDRIERCFASGRITSATAMVYMSDTARAAQLALAAGWPVGLHLNLTQPFDDPSTPAGVRERQARAVRHLGGGRIARIAFNPLLASLVRGCVADQLERFRELFGGEPTHIDGHNHIHLSPTVLFALPSGTALRTAETRPRQGLGTGWALRRARLALIARRHPTTEHFMPIDPLTEDVGSGTVESVLAQADEHTVEVMTHPDRDNDYELLMSECWREAIQRRTLGSFADLRHGRTRHSDTAPSRC